MIHLVKIIFNEATIFLECAIRSNGHPESFH